MLESHRKRRGSNCSSLLPYLIYSPLFGDPLWVWGMIIPFPGKGHLYKSTDLRDKNCGPVCVETKAAKIRQGENNSL
jgi:hypothetical protein